VGIPRQPFFNNLDADVGKAIDAALAVLAKLTAGMTDITLPAVAGGPILGAEAYHAQWITKTPELYQPPVRAALQNAGNIKAEPYVRALRDLAKARRDIGNVFTKVDLLALPTMADPPFRIETGLTRNVSRRNTSPFDAWGIPTISIPCGFTSAGLPIGLQIAGRRGRKAPFSPWPTPTSRPPTGTPGTRIRRSTGTRVSGRQADRPRVN
jgi:aspartyl-tRNA(Asn)/glutamyl-tRNA(Gln) amidotransferase subunit A